MKRTDRYILAALAAVALVSCSRISDEQPVDQGDVINVGGISSGSPLTGSVVTKSGERTDAEKIDWLLPSLVKGLDITYGKEGVTMSERVAILSLRTDADGQPERVIDGENDYAVYTFNYREDDGTATLPARWVGNGDHYFKGVHVSDRIRFASDPSELKQDRTVNNVQVNGIMDFTTDQSNAAESMDQNALGNYTLLSHYLAMPANTVISATVARIRLPFSHRLSRVVAYILIDPDLHARIKGYKKDGAGNDIDVEDPVNSAIKFCNVDVLAGVRDEIDPQTGLHTLTPSWAQSVRKVIPHYVGEQDEVVVYENENGFVYEGSSSFDSVEQLYASRGEASGYRRVVYQAVPVYDAIVRPTYTSPSMVMYDEVGFARESVASRKNQIDFEVSLDNGLTYDKHFEFDLDANYETKVYLRITAEGVDYNESGTQLWTENSVTDGFYGVNNQNGNTLSLAGSSWQRAFRNTGVADDKVTDGHRYDTDDEDLAQYVSTSDWIEAFLEAYEGGSHHGDYFILEEDITIDSSLLPADFVFTGHLDGFGRKDRRYHSITLTGGGSLFSGLDGIYTTRQEEEEALGNPIYGAGWKWEANVHKERNTWVPYKDPVTGTGWRAEVLDLKVIGADMFSPGAVVTGNVQNCKDGADGTHAVSDHIPALPKY